MAIYTVHLPPLPGRDERLAGAAFIRDGFSKSAFAFGVFWLISKRLWISAALCLLLLAVIWGSAEALRLPLFAPALLTMLTSFFIGLEGPGLQAWRLRRRGWTEDGPISARDEEEAERRFFDRQGEPSASLPPRSEPAAMPARDMQGVIGMFPEPGARG
jgi:hypothetical protein